MIGRWTPDSRAINASAGYGKTEALAVRLLAIFLSDDVARKVPRGEGEYNDAARNTVALTFARAAAGEIYERMLLLLSRALESDDELAKLRDKFADLVYTDAFAGVTGGELRELLVRLIREMGDLNIATIDSFFYRLIRAYSIELGLPGKVEMLSDGIDGVLGGELVRKLLVGPGTDDELLESCRMSWYGNDQKSFFDGCCDILRDTLKYRAHRDDPAFWGGDFAGFEPVPEPEREAAWEVCRRHYWGNLTAVVQRRKDELLALLEKCRRANSWGSRFTLEEQNLLRDFLEFGDRFPAQAPSGFSARSGWDFPPEIVRAMHVLIENGRRVLLSQCAMRTSALRSLVNKYLELYRAQVLDRGHLSFADLPMLLAEKPEDSGAQLGFLYEIFYRTNCRFRNFLIDEFQDTSRAQWEVLDAVSGSNDEGDHSLFIVGDVKQAIYGWRSGDSALMGEVVVRRGLPEPTDLGCSFRYGSGICAGLNHIFGSRNVSAVVSRLGGGSPRIPAECFRAVGDRWNRAFRPHAADPAKRIPGELSVLALAPDNEVDFTEGAARLIADRLRKLNFFERGLSGGVLVRDKKHGIRLRDALLEVDPSLEGRIVWEGDEGIANDPLVASLIAFGIWIQHSSDLRSGGVVRMNQLMRELVAGDFDRMRWATVIAERGIHGFLCEALTGLSARNISWGSSPASDWAPVNNGDVHALLALAREFDSSGGSRDFLRFAEVAAQARKKAVAVPGKLRLLTIHHSKGLTFDAVFVPMFRPARGGDWKRPEMSGMTAREEEDGGDWLLNAPREEGFADPKIAATILKMHADRCFEELCVLYVALTRARYGMYVFLEPLNKDKRNAYHPDWMDGGRFKGRRHLESLDTSYYMSDFVFGSCFGDPEEAEAAPSGAGAKSPFAADAPLPVEILPPPAPEDSSPAAAAEAARKQVKYLRRDFGEPWNGEREMKAKSAAPVGAFEVTFADEAPRMARSTPSKLEAPTELCFSLPRTDRGAFFGTRLHEFFESVGHWREHPAFPDDEIRAHYEACGENPNIVRLFDDEYSELWRERSFDVVLTDPAGGSTLVSGCFDRVQIYKDAAGGVARACIIDYKSDRVEAGDALRLAERYREQLRSYRRALAKLLRLSADVVECRIVFTRIGVGVLFEDPESSEDPVIF